jgi:hypothetical protein
MGNGNGSIYFRERRPIGNLVVEFITKGNWLVEERLGVKLPLEKGRE